jgi:hypothetical protein
MCPEHPELATEGGRAAPVVAFVFGRRFIKQGLQEITVAEPGDGELAAVDCLQQSVIARLIHWVRLTDQSCFPNQKQSAGGECERRVVFAVPHVE